MKNVVTPVQNRLRSFVVGEDKLKSSVDNSVISDISQRNTTHKDIPEVVSKLNLSDTCSTISRGHSVRFWAPVGFAC